MIKGLAHIGLFVKDVGISKKFYTEILGFEVGSEIVNPADGAKICFVRKGDCHIEIIEPEESIERKFGPFDHVAMLVDDIDSAVAELREKGVVFDTEEPLFIDVYDGIKYILFKGPDGEVLELNEML